MKYLLGLKETAKALGITEKELLRMLGITGVKERDKLARRAKAKKVMGGK